MIITAKFPSTCTVCNTAIRTGDRVEWEKGRKAVHATCAQASAEVPAHPPSSTRATEGAVLRQVRAERVARRTYLRGDTFPVRGLLKAAGCHWDREEQAWWMGDHAEATALAEKASRAPAEARQEPATAQGGGYQGRRYGRSSGGGSAANVPGYSSWCTGRDGCGCYDCAS